MDVLGRDMRVLIGESVYEDASVTVNGGCMFIEFAADDLEDVMIDLRPLDLCRGAVEERDRLRERVASLMLEEPSKTQGLYAAVDELQARLDRLGGQ